MNRALVFALAAAFCAGSVLAQPATPAPIVFFDIAGPNLAAQSKFYETVFAWKVEADGHFTAPVSPGPSLPAFLRVDPSERVVYIGVEDINATLTKITANGGRVAAPRNVVPGVVILALFLDPAGNRMGLVETRNGKPIVP